MEEYRPILLDTAPIMSSDDHQARKPRHRFHFEECWSNLEGVYDVIHRVWEGPGFIHDMKGLASKIRVTSACLNVLNCGASLEDVNETFIVLISKVKIAKRLSDYYPISLCNVLYKVVAKAFASRSRVVLNEVISETQSVFIPGRLISDNAIVRFECMHALKRRKKGRKGVMTIKLDMSKAYDRIEWSFISGQVVNFQKSTLCVSKRVTRGRAENLANILGVRLVECHERYLGPPSFVGKNKKNLFASIAQRVWDKVKGWQNKIFLTDGKEVLLKAVVQSIPVYSMSLFRLPKALISDLHRQNSSILHAEAGSSSSYMWRSFMWGKELLEKGVRWRVGSGEAILVYKDHWLPRPSTFKVYSPPILREDTLVSDLKLPSGS
ncbi:hypothetical protein Ddye_012360 [Dipteronia dyeriana]|uniref:Reverse transcriptase domain-containing protein n=1 Tax=Dipteronia dyeriana TaxID=168575 RepID=A0AAD9X484_9ROSI|nr:hypothetical protein Ddye_012360 [Dipteronia dyeriana]